MIHYKLNCLLFPSCLSLSFTSTSSFKENKPCGVSILTAVGHMQSTMWSCAVALTRGLCLAGGQDVRGSFPMAEPYSHPRDIGPGGDRVQVKHGSAPAVNGQCNAKDANDVHDYSCSGLEDKKR